MKRDLTVDCGNVAFDLQQYNQRGGGVIVMVGVWHDTDYRPNLVAILLPFSLCFSGLQTAYVHSVRATGRSS